jgi:peptidyl-prolyl cis-trans isomerase C
MRQFSTFLAAGAFAVSAGLAHAEDQTAATVVATVDGVEITLGQMVMTRAQLPEQYRSLPDDVLWQGILDQLVQQQLLAAQSHETTRVRVAMENEHRALLAGEAIEALTANAVSEDTLQAAYDARFATAEPEPEYNASHILVDTEEAAQAIIERLNAGEDFATVAQEASTGPSGPSGGELGWFGLGMMVPEFETAVTGMSVGDISAPVQTQFGWHVIRLNDFRLKAAPTLDELRGELAAQIQQTALEEELARLQEQAEVTLPAEGAFDPAILKNFTLLQE